MKKGNVVIVVIFAVVVIVGMLVLPKYMDKRENIEEKPKVKIVDENSDDRPIAVMINNNKAVWNYQSGLMNAYMVYELLVEGGITREMALYKDADVDKIASVRSARHYFLDYAMENDAIYVHWGWSPQAERDIKTYGIDNLNGLNYENKYFFRDNNLPIAYEHRGYTTTTFIKEGAKALGYSLKTDDKVPLDYSAQSVDYSNLDGVLDASNVDIQFSPDYTVHFRYNSETKTYEKYQNDTKMVDYTSKDDITAKNIITYKVNYTRIAGDDHNRLNMDDVGSGDGYFISEGKAVPINWSKESRSSNTRYTLSDGTELKVNDGNTFVEINPSDKSTSITSEES